MRSTVLTNNDIELIVHNRLLKAGYDQSTVFLDRKLSLIFYPGVPKYDIEK